MQKINFNDIEIGGNSKCFIIFDASATYSGYNEAIELVNAAADSGANAIKFQLIITDDAEKIMGEKEIKVEYSQKEELVFDALKRRELTIEEWRKLKKECDEKKIIMIVIPSFPETVEIIKELDIQAIKIAKGNMNNVLFIEKIAKSKKIIFFDAREKIEHLEIAMNICKNNLNENIIILHYPSTFPMDAKGAHLNSIKKLKEKFGCPIGFANHSSKTSLDYISLALGASVLEKTITTDQNKEGFGHSTSLQINELKSFVENVRYVEQSFGDSKILNISRVEDTAKRSISALNDIEKGEEISLKNITFRRPGNKGISAEFGFDILNKKAIISIKKDTFLSWDMLE